LENEKKFLNGDSSLTVDAFLTSNNENVSPVIDLPTFAMYAISNKINNPTEDLNLEIDSQIILDILDPTINCAFILDGDVININGTIVPSLINRLDMLKIGKYISFEGDDIIANPPRKIVKIVRSYSSNNIEIIVETDGLTFGDFVTVTNQIKLHQYAHYTDFISPSTTSNLANYVTRTVTLSNPSTGMRLLFDYNKPTDSFIDIYYKVCLTSDYTNLDNENWILLSDPTPYTDSQNYTTFIEHEIDVPDIEEINDTYTSYDQVMIKVVMRSNNTARCPRIKNFRLIALA
jgi:hypothetical protein